MQISKNFHRSEFKCKCGKCNYDTVDATLIQYVQAIRTHFGKPVTITSGNRCPEYNKEIGGAENSQHVLGRAADIVVKDVEPETVQRFCRNQLEVNGLGCYNTFTHIDSRTGKAEWNG